MNHKSSLLLSLSGIVAAIIITACVSNKSATDPTLGCSFDRPAIAHRAGGIVVGNPSEMAPIPCLIATGFRSSEVSIAETKDGTLLFQPAIQESGSPIGVVRSTDQGMTWNLSLSAENHTPRVTPVDHDMTVDPQTGRVYWVVGAPGRTNQQPRLDISDDDGMTWFKSPATILPIGHSFIFAGPPTKELKHLQTYPSVVYVCHGGKPQTCQKSIDGGITFSSGVPIPFPPDSGNKCMNWGLRGVVGSDGTVYVPNAPCDIPYVAISRDQGETWQLVRIANDEMIGFGNLSVGIDDRGILYATWVAARNRLPYLSISRDHGERWDQPLMIGAPGIIEAALPHVAVGNGGHVAISYYGSRNSPDKPFPAACLKPGGYMPSGIATGCPDWQDVTWNTYLIETRDALATQPLLWSVALNDPDQPTWYGCSPSRVGKTMGCTAYDMTPLPAWGRFDYYDMRMAADDIAWVGFVQACPNGRPVANNPRCPDTLKGYGQDSLWGMVGRLLWQSGNHAEK